MIWICSGPLCDLLHAVATAYNKGAVCAAVARKGSYETFSIGALPPVQVGRSGIGAQLERVGFVDAPHDEQLGGQRGVCHSASPESEVGAVEDASLGVGVELEFTLCGVVVGGVQDDEGSYEWGGRGVVEGPGEEGGALVGANVVEMGVSGVEALVGAVRDVGADGGEEGERRGHGRGGAAAGGRDCRGGASGGAKGGAQRRETATRDGDGWHKRHGARSVRELDND